MTLLSELDTADFQARLSRGSLALCIGPYTYNIRSNLKSVSDGLLRLYGDFRVAQEDAFIDFDVALQQRNLSQKLRGQAEFLFDRQSPFDSIPVQQAYAFLEWGMNWCISLHVNEFLKLHAAVVAKNGMAIVMPGIPGAGKSTLCAALGQRGWRVLSDEHALIPLGTTELVPLCRPVSLKNESIRAIQAFAPNAIFGPVSHNTHKGEVLHMKADLTPDSHDPTPVRAVAMLFPRYSTDEPQQLSAGSRTASFVLAAYHSFNYSLMGMEGFEAMEHFMENVDCFDLVYHDLDWAVARLEALLA